MSTDDDLVTEDVLDLLYALLRNAVAAAPIGDPPADGRVQWWEQHARSQEMTEQVWRRLHEWLVTTETEIHPLFSAAVADAAELRRLRARADRDSAALAREQAEWR